MNFPEVFPPNSLARSLDEWPVAFRSLRSARALRVIRALLKDKTLGALGNSIAGTWAAELESRCCKQSACSLKAKSWEKSRVAASVARS
jgi:hypothetical protein